MRTWMLCSTLLLGLGLPGTILATPLDYTFADVRLMAIDPDRGDRADGLVLSGSGELGRGVLAVGGVSMWSAGGRRGRDVDMVHAGFGLRHPLNDRFDAYGTAAIAHVDLSSPGSADDDDLGPLLSGGVRAWIRPRWEAAAGLEYLEVFGDGDVALRGDLAWHLTRNLAVAGGLAASDDDRRVSVGARWHFPR